MSEYAGKWVKVPIDQFKNDMLKIYSNLAKLNETNRNAVDDYICKVYDELKTPIRETLGSVGYNFLAPFTFRITLGKSIIIPTGFSISLEKDKGLIIIPRSGHGSKFGIRVTNTVGLIDSDFYRPGCSGGHIFVKLTYDGVNNIEPDFSHICDETGSIDNPSTINSLICGEEPPKSILFPQSCGFAQCMIVKRYLTENEYWDGGVYHGRHGRAGIAHMWNA